MSNSNHSADSFADILKVKKLGIIPGGVINGTGLTEPRKGNGVEKQVAKIVERNLGDVVRSNATIMLATTARDCKECKEIKEKLRSLGN